MTECGTDGGGISREILGFDAEFLFVGIRTDGECDDLVGEGLGGDGSCWSG